MAYVNKREQIHINESILYSPSESNEVLLHIVNSSWCVLENSQALPLQ